MKRKLISLILAAVMILSNVPFALAADFLPDEEPGQEIIDDTDTGLPGDGEEEPDAPEEETGTPPGPEDPDGDAPAAQEPAQEEPAPSGIVIAPFNNGDLKIGVVSRSAAPGQMVEVNINITENPGISRINALRIELKDGLSLYYPEGYGGFVPTDSSTWPYRPGSYSNSEMIPVMGFPQTQANNDDSPVVGSNYIEVSFQDRQNPHVTYATGTLITLLVQVPDGLEEDDTLDIELVGQYGGEDKGTWGTIYNGETLDDFISTQTSGTITIANIMEIRNNQELKEYLFNNNNSLVLEIQNNINLSFDTFERVNNNRTVTINLNGNTVNLTNTQDSWADGLGVDGKSSVTVNGPGTLNVIGGNGIVLFNESEFKAQNGAVIDSYARLGSAAIAHNGSTITIEDESSFRGSVEAQDNSTVNVKGNITSGNSSAVYADSGGSVTVTGNVTDTSGNIAVGAHSGGSITVTGTVTGNGNGVGAHDAGSTVVINGNINTTEDYRTAVYAQSGGSVTVTGDITSKASSIDVYRGGSVTVTGDVTCNGDYYSAVSASNAGSVIIITGNVKNTKANDYTCVRAYRGGSITITGDVTGSVNADRTGSSITVNGSITSAGNTAANAYSGGIVTVTGDVSGGYGGAQADGRGSNVTVGGDAAVTGTEWGNAAAAYNGGTVAVVGDAKVTAVFNGNWKYAAYVWGKDAEVTIGGNATTTGGAAVSAGDGGKVTVTGDAIADNGSAVHATNWNESGESGTEVHIGGNAIANGEWGSAAYADGEGVIIKIDGDATGRDGGAAAYWGGRIEITGTATGGRTTGSDRNGWWGGNGAEAIGDGAVVVAGNAAAQSTWANGAEARDGGTVIVRGNATAQGNQGVGASAGSRGKVYVYGNIQGGGNNDVAIGYWGENGWENLLYKNYSPTLERVVLRDPLDNENIDGYYWDEFSSKNFSDWDVPFVYKRTNEQISDQVDFDDIDTAEKLKEALQEINESSGGIFELTLTDDIDFTDMFYLSGAKFVTLNLNGNELIINYEPQDPDGWEGAFEFGNGVSLTVAGSGTIKATGGTGINSYLGSELLMKDGAEIYVYGKKGCAIYADGGSVINVTEAININYENGIVDYIGGELVNIDGGGVWANNGSKITVAGNVKGGWIGAQADNGSTVIVGGNVQARSYAANAAGWRSYVEIGGSATSDESVAARADWWGSEVLVKGSAISDDSFAAEALHGGKVYVIGDINGAHGSDVAVGDWAYWNQWGEAEDVNFFSTDNPTRRRVALSPPYDGFYWDEFNNENQGLADEWGSYSYVYKRSTEEIPPDTFADIDNEEKLNSALNRIKNLGEGSYTIEISGGFTYNNGRSIDFDDETHITINLNGYVVYLGQWHSIYLSNGAKLTVNDSAGEGILFLQDGHVSVEGAGSELAVTGSAELNVYYEWGTALAADYGGKLTVTNVAAVNGNVAHADDGSELNITGSAYAGDNWNAVYAENDSSINIGGDLRSDSDGYAIQINDNSSVTVGGDVYTTGECGVSANNDSSINIGGDVTATGNRDTVRARYGSDITIGGSVCSQTSDDYAAAVVSEDNSTIYIGGSVEHVDNSGRNSEEYDAAMGVWARDNSEITVMGDVSSNSVRTSAGADRAVVNIGGSVYNYGADGIAVNAGWGATVFVNRDVHSEHGWTNAQAYGGDIFINGNVTGPVRDVGVLAEEGGSIVVIGDVWSSGNQGVKAGDPGTEVIVYGYIHAEDGFEWSQGIHAYNGATVYAYGDIFDNSGGMVVIGTMSENPGGNNSIHFALDNAPQKGVLLGSPHAGYLWDRFYDHDPVNPIGDYSNIYVRTGNDDANENTDVSGDDELLELLTGGYLNTEINILNNITLDTDKEIVIRDGRNIVINIPADVTVNINYTGNVMWAAALRTLWETSITVNGPGTLNLSGDTGIHAERSTFTTQNGATVNVSSVRGGAISAFDESDITVTNATSANMAGIYTEESTVEVTGNVSGGGWSGIQANYYSDITVGGNVTTTNNTRGVWAQDGSTVTVEGNVTGTGGGEEGGAAAHAENEGTLVTIKGDADFTGGTDGYAGVGARAWHGGKVIVNGDVSSNNGEAAEAMNGGIVTVGGDAVSSNYGWERPAVISIGEDSLVTIEGTVTGSSGGALAEYGGEIKINNSEAETYAVTGTGTDEWNSYGVKTYSGGTITVTGDIKAYGDGAVSYGELAVYDEEEDEEIFIGSYVKITGSVESEANAAIRTGDGGKVEVTLDAISSGSEAALAEAGGTTIVGRDAKTTGWSAAAYAEGDGACVEIGRDATASEWHGAFADGDGAVVLVKGSADGSNAGASARYGGEVTVNVDASGSCFGAFAEYGGKVDVKGDAVHTGNYNGGAAVWAQYGGAEVTVGGTVITENAAYAVEAGPGSTITVKDIEASDSAIKANGGTVTVEEGIEAGLNGVEAYSDSTVTVMGDIDAGDTGIIAHSGGIVRVHGTITAGVTDIYINGVEYGAGNPERQVEQGGILWNEYTDRSVRPAKISFVYVSQGTPDIPEITTATLPEGSAGFAYSANLTASGGAVRWSIFSGRLPTGLSLNTATGQISGTATAAGTFTFTVTATNNLGLDRKELTITINDLTDSVELEFDEAAVTKIYGDGSFINPIDVTVPTSYDGTITYSSSDTSVAAVNASTGAVTINGAGGAVITAYAEGIAGEYAPGTASYELTVNKKEITVTADNASKTYGDANPALSYSFDDTQLVGTDSEDLLSVSLSTTATATSNAGNWPITGTASAGDNYTVTVTAGTLTINKRPISVTGATVASKIYDGTTAATVSAATFSGLLSGQTLALGTDFTVTGTFADKDAATGKNVTVAVTLSDTERANNYSFTAAGSDTVVRTANITKRALTITDADVPSKTFDKTTAATVSSVTFGNLADGEAFAIGTDYTAAGVYVATTALPAANAGTKNATVTVTLIADGPVSKNYSITTTAARFTKTGCVIEKASPAAPVALDPEFDLSGSNNRFLFTAAPPFTALGDYQFSRNGGTAWTSLSTSNASIDGSTIALNLGNSSVASEEIWVRITGTANVNESDILKNTQPISVNITGNVSIAGTAVYGNTLTAAPAATGINAPAEDRVFTWKTDNGSTTLGTGTTYTLKSTDIGKQITVSMTAPGFFGERVSAPTAVVARKTITPLVTADNKVYDGTTAATVSFSFATSATNPASQLVGTDTVIVTANGSTFADANAGNNKVVTLRNWTADDNVADNKNYIINKPADPRANITPRPVTVTADSITITYGEAIPNVSSAYGFESAVWDNGTQAYTTNTGVLPGQHPAFTGSLTRAAGTGAGTYAINRNNLALANGTALNGGSPNFIAANYSMVFVPGSLTINRAAFTYAVANQNISKDAPLSAVVRPATAAGVNGENVNGTIAWFTDAARTIPAGDDAFNAAGSKTLYWTFTAASTGVGANYVQTPHQGVATFNVVENELTALTWTNASAAPAISAAGVVSRTYGDGVFTKTAGTQGTVVYTSSEPDVAAVDQDTGAVTIKNAGTTIITATEKTAGTYRNTSVSYELDVSPKALTIAATGNSAATKPFDATTAVTGVNLNLTGWVGDDADEVEVDVITANWQNANITTSTNPARINVSAVTFKYTADGATNYNYFVAPRTGITVTGGGITARNISDATVTINGTYTYNTLVQVPPAAAISVVAGGRTLVLTTDYTQSIGTTDNSGRAAGTATVTITGRGNYTGTRTATYEVNKAPESGLTYSVAAQNISQSSKISSIAAPVSGVGINNETVSGELRWYDTYAKAQAGGTDFIPSDDESTFGTLGTKTLWWRYVTANYEDKVCPAPGVAFTVTDPPKQNIRFALPSANSPDGVSGVIDATYGDAPIANAASNISPGGSTAITYDSTDKTVATVAANGTVTIVGAGTTEITASAVGGNGYAPTTVSYTLKVAKRQLTIGTATTGTTLIGSTAIATGTYNRNAAPSKVYDGTNKITGSVNNIITVGTGAAQPLTLNLTGFAVAADNRSIAIDTVEAVWSSSSAGTTTINVIDVTLKAGVSGDLSANYEVVPRDNVAVAGAGITPKPINATGVTQITFKNNLQTGFENGRYVYNGLLQRPGTSDIEVKVNVGTDSDPDWKTLSFGASNDFTYAIVSTNSALSASLRTSAGTNVGTVTLRVTGVGNYSNTADIRYIIGPAPFTNTGTGGIPAAAEAVQGTLPANIAVPKTGIGVLPQTVGAVNEVVNGTLTWYDSQAKAEAGAAGTNETASPFTGSPGGRVRLWWRFVPGTTGVAANYIGQNVTVSNVDGIGPANADAANAAVKIGMVEFTITPPAEQTLTWNNINTAPAITGGGTGGNGGTVTRTYGDGTFAKSAARTPASGGAVTYASSDQSVATVSTNGTVTIRGAGITTITATAAAVAGRYQSASINYTLVVNPKALTIGTATTGTGRIGGSTGTFNRNEAVSKTFDGTADITGSVTLNLTGFVGTTDINNVTLRSVDAVWSTPNVGIKTIDVIEVQLGGSRGYNYYVMPRDNVTVATVTSSGTAASSGITEASLAGADVRIDGTYRYTGMTHMPHPDNVSVILGGNPLEFGTDYVYAPAGTTATVAAGGTITVTGVGNYDGSTATGTFGIDPADYIYSVESSQTVDMGALIDGAYVIINGAAPADVIKTAIAPEKGLGVAAETVAGTLRWYQQLSDARTGTEGAHIQDNVSPFDTAGAKTLYWRFVPTDTNYTGARFGSVAFNVIDTAATNGFQDISFDLASVTRTYSYNDKFTNVAANRTPNGGAITYRSSDRLIADVDEYTGEVTVKRAGTAVITATAEAAGGYAVTSRSYVLTINRRELTIAGSGNSADTKPYDGDTFVTGVNLTLTGYAAHPGNTAAQPINDFTEGLVAVDPMSIIAEWTSKNAGTTRINVSHVALTGGDNGDFSDNYYVRLRDSDKNLPVTGGGITRATIVVTPDDNLGKDFSSPAVADPAGYLTYTWSGNAPMETPRFTGTLTRTTPTVHNVGAYLISRNNLALANGVAGTETEGFNVNNYNALVFDPAPKYFTINKITADTLSRNNAIQWNDGSTKTLPLVTGLLATVPGYLAADVTTANRLQISIGGLTFNPDGSVTKDPAAIAQADPGGILDWDSIRITGTSTARTLTYALKNDLTVAHKDKSALITVTVDGFTNLEPVKIELSVDAIDFLEGIVFKPPTGMMSFYSDDDGVTYLQFVRGSGQVINLKDYITAANAGFNLHEHFDVTFNTFNNNTAQLTAAGVLTIKASGASAAPVTQFVTATLRGKSTSPYAGETRTAPFSIKVIAGLQNATLANATVNVNRDVTLTVGKTFTRAITYAPTNAAIESVKWEAFAIDPVTGVTKYDTPSDVVSVDAVTGRVTALKPGRAAVRFTVIPDEYDLSVTTGANAGKAAQAKADNGFSMEYTVFVPTATVNILTAADKTADILPKATADSLTLVNADNDARVTGQTLRLVRPGPNAAAVTYEGPVEYSDYEDTTYTNNYLTSLQLTLEEIVEDYETVIWTTNNRNIANVDANGLVTAGTTSGTATITASVRLVNQFTGAVTTTVSKTATVRIQTFVPPMNLSLAFTNLSSTPANPNVIETGKTRTLRATLNAGSGYAAPTTTGVTWQIVPGSEFDINGNPAATGTVATVNASGVVTGRGPGTAVVRATSRIDASGKSIFEDFTVRIETPVTALSLSHRNAFSLSTIGAGKDLLTQVTDERAKIPGNEWTKSWNEAVITANKNNGAVTTIYNNIIWTMSRYDVLEFVDGDGNAIDAGVPYTGDSVKVRVKENAVLTSNVNVILYAEREQVAAPFTGAVRSNVTITVTNNPIVNATGIRISNTVPHTVERTSAVTRTNNYDAADKIVKTNEYVYDYFLNPLKVGSTFTPNVAYTPTSASNRNITWSAKWADPAQSGNPVADGYIRLNLNTGAVTGLKSTSGKVIEVIGEYVNNPEIKVQSTRPETPARVIEYYSFAVVQRATRVTFSAERGDGANAVTGTVDTNATIIRQPNDNTNPDTTVTTVTPVLEPAIAWDDVVEIIWGPATTASSVATIKPVNGVDLDGDTVPDYFKSLEVTALKPGTLTVTAGVITKDNTRVNASLRITVQMPVERIVIRNPAGTSTALPRNQANNPHTMANGTAVALAATVNGAITASAARLPNDPDNPLHVPAVTAERALTAATVRTVTWSIEKCELGTDGVTLEVIDGTKQTAVDARNPGVIAGVASVTNAGRVTAIGNGYVKVTVTSTDNPSVSASVYIKTEVRAATVRMQQTAFSMRPGDINTINAVTTLAAAVPAGQGLYNGGDGQFTWYANANNRIAGTAALPGDVFVLEYWDAEENDWKPLPITAATGVSANSELKIRAGANGLKNLASRAVTVTVRTASGRTASVVITVNPNAQAVVNMRTNKSTTWIAQGKTETLSIVWNTGFNPATRKAWAAPANRNVEWRITEAYTYQQDGTPVLNANKDSVATIDLTTGRVTANGPGYVVVEASSYEKDASGINARRTATCRVYVMAKP